MYYRNAQAALVVYDITRASSLDKAKSWVKELQRQANPHIVIALCGNKLDLVSRPSGHLRKPNVAEGEDDEEEEVQQEEGLDDLDDGEDVKPTRQVSTEEAKAFAEENHLLFFETSAKLGENVNEVFTAIGKN